MNSPYRQPEIIKEGLDRHNLAILRNRFMSVNGDRLARLRSALSDRQQVFVDILPLLFHSNHPMMPGFVSHQTPARISHYRPTKREVLTAKMLAKSFTLRRDPSAEADIFGIFIMGSVGTIAQSEGSDLDIWVCHRPGLLSKALKELQTKCEKISRWVEQLRLEVHFFVMDHEAFKARKFSALNAESSGSAQQVLLLDEFYRSAIFIAGRTPLWWYVPPDSEKHFREYTQTLLYKRFVPNDTVLDFGGITEILPSEFLSAGIWQLYKAIESPYKSVLKLLLLEAYVANFPNVQPLSLTFKAMIFSGELDINALDSYVMIYQCIESYLQTNKQFKRLELARRSFYFKVNKPLSRPPTRSTKSWQRRLLEKMTYNWSWSPEHIQFLDGRDNWKASEVNVERNLLVAEINHSYRYLLDFANKTGSAQAISTEELTVLGRKLQAAFERKPGKIESINPGIAGDLSEDMVIIRRISSENLNAPVWTAFSQDISQNVPAKTAIKSSATLGELVLWCYFNRVITRGTRLELDDKSSNTVELKRIFNKFKGWLPLPLEIPKHDNFQRSAKPESVLFLINFATNDIGDVEYQRMSENTDALRYGGFEENLVASIDIVVRNSWNEITMRRFDKASALLDAIIDFLQLTIPGTHQRLPLIQVFCIGENHAATITRRVERWINDISRCFFSGNHAKHRRFIFQIANAYHCIQFKGMKPELHNFESESSLVEHLAQEQKHQSSLVIDGNGLKGHPLHAVAEYSHINAIDVFYRRFDMGIEVYVVDEYGSIFHTMLHSFKKQNSLKILYKFLRMVIYRQTRVNPMLNNDFGVYPIHFMELIKKEKNNFIAKCKNIAPVFPEDVGTEFKAVAHLGANNELSYDFYCDEREFLDQRLDDQRINIVSRFILDRCGRNELCSVYIGDLDLSQVVNSLSSLGRLQTIHYLQIKHRLESQLNQVIDKLRHSYY